MSGHPASARSGSEKVSFYHSKQVTVRPSLEKRHQVGTLGGDSTFKGHVTTSSVTRHVAPQVDFFT
jgi:hypothetical protein